MLSRAGGHGGAVLDTVRQVRNYEPVTVLDDGRESGESHHRSELPILYGRRHLTRLRAEGVEGVVIAIGDVYIRSKLGRVAAECGFEWCTIIHPSAILGTDVKRWA